MPSIDLLKPKNVTLSVGWKSIHDDPGWVKERGEERRPKEIAKGEEGRSRELKEPRMVPTRQIGRTSLSSA